MALHVVGEDKRGPGGEHVGSCLADAEFAGDQDEGAGEKDNLAGPPHPAVRAVASAFAARDKHDQSSR